MRALFLATGLTLMACTPCAPLPCPENSSFSQDTCSCSGPGATVSEAAADGPAEGGEDASVGDTADRAE
jgi:hypothetical protein